MPPSGNIVYRINGGLWLYVRWDTERNAHHFVGAKDGLSLNRWWPALPDEAELVHDTEARAETFVAQLETQAAIQERDILNEIMAEAVKLLPSHEAERLRHLFLSKMEKVPVKSR